MSTEISRNTVCNAIDMLADTKGICGYPVYHEIWKGATGEVQVSSI